MSGEAAADGRRRRRARAWPAEAREEPCPICLGPTVDAARALPRTHVFCGECIQRWLATTRTCPLCRRLVGIVLRAEWRIPSGRDLTRRPRGRLERTRARRETRARSARRSRSVPARSARRSRSRSPRPPVRSSSWHGDRNQRSRFEEPPREDEDREWLRRVARERPMGAGDPARRPDGPRL